MTAIQTVNTKKAVDRKTNTPPTPTSSTRSTQPFRQITQKIISSSSAAPTPAPRCHVTPVLPNCTDRGSLVAATERWSIHADGKDGLSNPIRKSARQALDHKFLQAAQPSTDHNGNNPSHMVADAHNDKSASQVCIQTPIKMSCVRVAAPEKSMAGQKTKGDLQNRNLVDKHKKSNELCKDCKTSIMESVCFINNDGRITAALTSTMHARSRHHCLKPGCAAYQGNLPAKSACSRKSSSKKQVLLTQPQPKKIQSHAEIEDRLSVCSSTSLSSVQKGSHINDSKSESVKESSEFRNLEGDCERRRVTTVMDVNSHSGIPDNQIGVQNFSPCGDLDVVVDGLSHSEENLCSSAASQHNRGNQQSNEENGGRVESCRNPATSRVSSDILAHGDNDEMDSVNRAAVNELHHFKSFCYHGDNEYSCSEDGTDATTTPNSLIRGAFENHSTLTDADQEHSEDKASQQRRSSVASMRQRYLDSLSEQEAERVRLRKQEIMARKQAEDWKLDCHMEELLHKLAPNGEARVKVLVEAFEQVMHHSDSESSQTNHQEQNRTHEEQDQLDESTHTDSSA